jgi:glycyl-tRNA synthetase beta chain
VSLEFLLEIGTEEIPHWMIRSAIEQLAKIDLFGASPRVDATARRLVVRASGVPEKQADSEELVSGPPKSGGAGAAQGFAKKMGVRVEDLSTTMTAKGEYFVYLRKKVGRPTAELLAESLPALILGLQWPKTMYWTGGKTGPRFIRPIRWMVALLGGQVIPFEIAGVMSGTITRGHRKLGASAIPVTAENYEEELRRNFVILSSDERREKIVTEAAKLGAKHDDDLVETLTFITEYPAAIRGDFDPAYLELPAEVLTTVMRHHQKYFSVEMAPGALGNHFVAVMNIPGDPDGLVKKGNERVLRARFNDARFFWNVDQQNKLRDRVEDLKNVTFQAKLGSYHEKTMRVVELVKELGGDEHAQRAALLAKCDLTTEMVKEFTDLQGVVGGLYAKFQGESDAVASAIYEHYKPLSMEDSIPSSPSGQIVALADKLDTLRGCFAIGLVPSGSKDPFALRRAAQGVIKILAEAKLDFKLAVLASGELRAFLLERIQYYFREIRGYQYDEVNAVLASGVSTIADVEARLAAVAAVRPTEDFEPLAASFKRIRNILRQAEFTPSAALQAKLLEEGPEQKLHSAFQTVRSEIGGASYEEALGKIASLRPQVDLFFDKVLVNAKDASVRANRLTLLSALLTEFSTIADFSEIVTSGDKS